MESARPLEAGMLQVMMMMMTMMMMVMMMMMVVVAVMFLRLVRPLLPYHQVVVKMGGQCLSFSVSGSHTMVWVGLNLDRLSLGWG